MNEKWKNANILISSIFQIQNKYYSKGNCHYFLEIVILSLVSLTMSVFAASAANEDRNLSLMENGMWQDPATGLIWDRCSLGQKWDGVTCTGEAKKYAWKDAIVAAKQQTLGGFNDWALPSVSELGSIHSCSTGVDLNSTLTKWDFIPSNAKNVTINTGRFCNQKSATPTINSTIFPSTIADWYWTSTIDPIEHDPWYVLFVTSMTYGRSSANKPNYVRVVRTSRALGNESLVKVFKDKLRPVDLQYSSQLPKLNPQNQQAATTQSNEAADDSTKVRNELMGKGVWTDPKTGLMWARCMVGQTWSGNACSGTPLSATHHCGASTSGGGCLGDTALNAAELARALNNWNYAGFQDWRLPTIEELQKAYPCSDGATVPEASGETLYFKCSDGKLPYFDRDIFPSSGAKYPPVVLSASASRDCGGSCYKSLSWYLPFINSQNSVHFEGNILAVRSNEMLSAWKTIQQNAKISIKGIEQKEASRNAQIQNDERVRQQQEESRRTRVCSKGYFYPGKAVGFKPAGAVYQVFNTVLDAVVLGSGGGKVSIKLIDRKYLDEYGKVLEIPCYSDQLF